MRKRLLTPEDEVIVKRFGERLTKLLLEFDVPQNVLADSIGVHPNTVGLWCRGKTQISVTQLYKLKDYFRGVDLIDWLLPEFNY